MHSHPRKGSNQEKDDTAVSVADHRRNALVERRTTSSTSNEDTTTTSRLRTNKSSKHNPHRQTDRLLKVLSEKMQECVASITQKQDDNADPKTKKRPKPYVPAPPSTKKRKRQQQQDAAYWQQPRKSDYGGIGLARASLWIDLQDPSHQPKLVEEFQEHVPGFFGKQRTKAMKKQLDGNMLWRQLLQQKKQQQQQDSSGSTSKKKKKEKSPNERVEAMIQAGVL